MGEIWLGLKKLLHQPRLCNKNILIINLIKHQIISCYLQLSFFSLFVVKWWQKYVRARVSRCWFVTLCCCVFVVAVLLMLWRNGTDVNEYCFYALFGNTLSSHTEYPEPQYQATAEDVQWPAGEEPNWQKLLYCIVNVVYYSLFY